VRTVAIYLTTCVVAALAPLVPRPAASERAGDGGERGNAVAWPERFEGRPLTPLPLGDRDRRFAADFPGDVGRFTDGNREVILRRVARATRRLHPASDCLAAVGFRIEPLPARVGADSAPWRCFGARRATADLTVCEQIRDAAGRTWPDPSTWYWPALLGQSRGPWWSTTVVEAHRAPPP
jgi:hypothetical protein